MSNETNILENYKIVSELYRGPSSVVYLVEDLQKQRVVLKKFLYDHRTELKLSEQMARIHREIMLHQQLKHPNIATTLGEGQDRDKIVLILEYIEGSNLLDLLKRRQLTALEVLQLVRQLCQGLIFIHNLGIVHRDIKPSNVMVDLNGHLKLIDFGSARQMFAPGITQTRMLVGTITFMSPEQLFEASRVDGRSDLFSVGVMMYQMLSGQLPFAHEQPAEIINQLLYAEPTPLYRLDPTIPLSLSDLVQKLLSKDPDFRFASAESLLKSLDAIQRDPQIYYQHGFQVGREGRQEESRLMFRKAIDLDSGFTMAWQALGDLDFEAGRWEEAIASYQQVEQEESGDAENLYKLGQTFFHLERFEDALKLLHRAWIVNPHEHRVVLSLAQTYLALGDTERAHEHFLTLSQEQPDWAAPHHEMGRILYRQGQIQQALEHFTQAASLEPTDTRILFNLASIFLEQNQLDRALPLFEQVIRAQPEHAEAHHNLGCCHYLLGRMDAAEQEMLTAVNLQPDWAPSYVLLGMIYDEQDDFDKTVAMYREAQRLDPRQVKTYLYLASLYYRHWRIRALVEVLENATLVAPDAAMVRFQLGRAYGHQGRSEDQLRELENCLYCSDITPEMAAVVRPRVKQLRSELKKNRRFSWPFLLIPRRAAV